MEVLLIQDVDNLGYAGDVKKVANGFGRNYLLPQNLAVLATPGALKQAQTIRKTAEKYRAQETKEAEAIANQLVNLELLFERRAGETGKLYGSVTSGDIAEAIKDKTDLEIDKRKVALPEPIRGLGEQVVTIKLMIDVATTIKVEVVPLGGILERERLSAAEVAELIPDYEPDEAPTADTVEVDAFATEEASPAEAPEVEATEAEPEAPQAEVLEAEASEVDTPETEPEVEAAQAEPETPADGEASEVDTSEAEPEAEASEVDTSETEPETPEAEAAEPVEASDVEVPEVEALETESEAPEVEVVEVDTSEAEPEMPADGEVAEAEEASETEAPDPEDSESEEESTEEKTE